MQFWLKVLEDKGILTVTKLSSENVHTLISMPEDQNKPTYSTDSEIVGVVREKLQKEAETFFAGISLGLPRRMLGLTPEDHTDELVRTGMVGQVGLVGHHSRPRRGNGITEIMGKFLFPQDRRPPRRPRAWRPMPRKTKFAIISVTTLPRPRPPQYTDHADLPDRCDHQVVLHKHNTRRFAGVAKYRSMGWLGSRGGIPLLKSKGVGGR